jgi:hypothetical protein
MTDFGHTHEAADRRPGADDTVFGQDFDRRARTVDDCECRRERSRCCRSTDERDCGVNGQVIGVAPAVSLAFNMISQAATLSRDQLSYSNQGQLNSIGAMVQLMQQCARPRSRDDAVTFKEAFDLAMQVAAAARGS